MALIHLAENPVQLADDIEYMCVRDSLNDGQRAEMREWEALARGYVWGQEDASGNRIAEIVSSHHFSRLYAVLWAKRELGESKVFRPIQDAFRCWMDGHDMGEHFTCPYV